MDEIGSLTAAIPFEQTGNAELNNVLISGISPYDIASDAAAIGSRCANTGTIRIAIIQATRSESANNLWVSIYESCFTELKN